MQRLDVQSWGATAFLRKQSTSVLIGPFTIVLANAYKQLYLSFRN